MRRPVKPFVTEYRGGARRQAGQGQSPKTDLLRIDPDAQEPRTASPAWPQTSAPEDGYEAALRAADALFSGGRQPAPSAPDSPDSSETAPGRILRVLDEPPSEEMLRLEAEFAPKRRGRKPGSKNKPKVQLPALVDSDLTGAAPAAPPAGGASLALATEPQGLPAIPAVTTRSAMTVVVRPAGVSAGAPRGERYAWVRTRLKPGEQWKRRLPKVAW